MTGLDWTASSSAAALQDAVGLLGAWEPSSHPTDKLVPGESWFPWKRVPPPPHPNSFSVSSGIQEEARTVTLSAEKQLWK